MRIAVCDDDEDFRSLLDMTIREDPDLELVATAGSLDPLLSALPAVDVEGVLLDWLMPDDDQEDAVRRLRSALPEAVIVVLTAVVRSAAEQRALAAGADGLVEKGPGARELLDRCKEILLASRP
jgi:DNA-binding NarL/FixJ family response regulator